MADSHPEIASEAIGYQSLTSSIHKTLCVLAVHYNNADEVRRYVDHVLGLPLPEGWRVVVSVTDNSLNWPTGIDMDERCFIWTPEANLGYLNGCAYGLACWRSTDGDDPDWVAVTNTDIAFDQDALLQLLTTAWDETVGSVAPQIRTPIHQDQNPFMRSRPSLARLRLLRIAFTDAWWRRAVLRVLRSSTYLRWSRLKSRRGFEPAAREEALSAQRSTARLTGIYAPHGSVMFFPPSFFNTGCSLTMPWMMYGEEIHIAEQIRRAELEVLWAPEIRVEHRMASTTGASTPDQRMDWRATSLDQLIDLYFNEPVAEPSGHQNS
ncbi:MAG: hypothetical protein HKN37_07630 [Rhodothermales bacterium]|nr:hypothetical protein [Rhodothermales bacterium]